MKPKPNRIRVLLADDHPVVREGLRHSLGECEQIEIVGEAGDGPGTLRQALELLPDVLLLDINLPELNGLEVAARLRQQAPQIKVLALTVHDAEPYVLGMIRAGAVGYVLKDAAPAEVVQAIESVHAGRPHFSRRIQEHIFTDYVAQAGHLHTPSDQVLTERENQVLALIAQGFTNKQMAVHLGLGVRTVESHRSRIMEKLQVTSVARLTQYAISKGIIQLPSSG